MKKKEKEYLIAIRLGDVVMLRSRSPKMTVETISSNNYYWCKWWDKQEKRFFRESFYEWEIKKI